MRLLFAVLLIHCLTIAVAGLAYAESPAAVLEETEYRIGPEDVLEIQIWERPDLAGLVTVSFPGTIQLPLVGGIEAAGQSVAELGRHLTERYQLLDPSIPEVMVAVAEYGSQSVTVVGEVRAPGPYAFRTIPDLWAVILKAGGATDMADLARVQVVREEPDADEALTVTVDLSQGIEETLREELPDLQPRDTIVIPSIGENAISGDRFQVLGAVQSPGTYRISAAETVIEAISASGGPLPYADLRQVRLTRSTSEGVVSYKLDLHGYLYEARPLADLELKPGDTITVPGSERSPLGIIVDGFVKLAPVVTAMVSLAWALDR
jgi:polysaccharide export outer membrane protein